MFAHAPHALYRNLNSFRNPTLEFVAAPALAPAEVAVDANLMAIYEAELKRVCTPIFQDTRSFYISHLLRLKRFPSPMTKKIFKAFLLSSFCHQLP